MEDLETRAKKILEDLQLDKKKIKIQEIEKESQDSSFWQNHAIASEKMKELSSLQKEILDSEKLSSALNMGNQEELSRLVNDLEYLLYLSGEFDRGGAIIAIHSGQGGVEAMDWCQMLYRMYLRFCEKKNWKTETIIETPGEEAGLKSVTFEVDGEFAYGLLKKEAGVHRLVRLSPFNADHLRQTSFALVEVVPEISQDSEIKISEDDLEWDFYRASSHGGQNVQKVSSAVRLKHKPTGIVVTAQSERYQNQNREYALKILRGKLWVISEEERRKKEEELKGGYKTPGWGNQIRSYVLHPYKMVKDLRTGVEKSNAEEVLNGDLDEFIKEEIRV